MRSKVKIGLLCVLFLVCGGRQVLASQCGVYDQNYVYAKKTGKLGLPLYSSLSSGTSTFYYFILKGTLPKEVKNLEWDSVGCSECFDITTKTPPSVYPDDLVPVFNIDEDKWELKKDYREKRLWDKNTDEEIFYECFKKEGSEIVGWNLLVEGEVPDDYYCRIGDLPDYIVTKNSEPITDHEKIEEIEARITAVELKATEAVDTAISLDGAVGEIREKITTLEEQTPPDNVLLVSDSGDVPFDQFSLINKKYMYQLPEGVIVDEAVFFENEEQRAGITVYKSYKRKTDRYLIWFFRKSYNRIAKKKAQTRSIFDPAAHFIRWYSYQY